MCKDMWGGKINIKDLKTKVKTWKIHIIFFIFVFIWSLLAYFVFTDPTDQWFLLLLYIIFLPSFIWLIVGKIIVENKQKIIKKLNEKKPGSKPFEYLFFIFLFIATYYVTIIASYINDDFDLINFLIHFSMISIFYTGSIICGWLHYVETIVGKETQKVVNRNTDEKEKPEKKIVKKRNKLSMKFIFISLIVIGIFFSALSLPYFLDKNIFFDVNENVKDGFTIELPELNCTIRVIYESKNGFIANNAIKFSANANFDHKLDIKKLVIVFDGAERYYTSEENKQEIYSDYKDAVLELNISRDEEINAKYFGEKDIIYHRGGDFGIRVQYIIGNASSLGEFEQQNVLQIQHYDVLQTIKSNRILLGLSWLLAGLALLAPGLNGFITYRKEQR